MTPTTDMARFERNTAAPLLDFNLQVLDQALASISVDEEKNLRATWEGVEATTELDAEADIPESALPAIK